MKTVDVEREAERVKKPEWDVLQYALILSAGIWSLIDGPRWMGWMFVLFVVAHFSYELGIYHNYLAHEIELERREQ